MDYTIIDAHAHLWLRQDTVVDGFPIRTLENGHGSLPADSKITIGINRIAKMYIPLRT